MIKELVKMASKLDALGLSKEADIIDSLIEKMASDKLMSEMTSDEGAKDEEFEDLIRSESKEIAKMKSNYEHSHNADMYGLYSSDENWPFGFALTAYRLLDAYKKGEVSEKPLNQLAASIKKIVFESYFGHSEENPLEVIKKYIEVYNTRGMNQIDKKEVEGLNWD